MERDIDRARKRSGCAAINPVDILAGKAATAFMAVTGKRGSEKYKRNEESEEKLVGRQPRFGDI